ncbi:MAG: hypothetical protein LUE09_14815 [Synergistaceae bacterium]|nr:hypothetical protein [Synergistaceae bacterium]
MYFPAMAGNYECVFTKQVKDKRAGKSQRGYNLRFIKDFGRLREGAFMGKVKSQTAIYCFSLFHSAFIDVFAIGRPFFYFYIIGEMMYNSCKIYTNSTLAG